LNAIAGNKVRDFLGIINGLGSSQDARRHALDRFVSLTHSLANLLAASIKATM
jgi:hypothetical protein